MRVFATALIRAPHDKVWAVLTDFPSMHRWFLGLTDVRLVGPARIGTERRVTFVGGLTHRETITAWSPPAHLELVAAGPSGPIAAGARVDIHLAEDPGGVRIDWSIEYRLSLGRLFSALVVPLGRGIVGAALRLSLARLKRLAQTAAQN